MSTIGEVFARCRSDKRAAFIPYLTGGDPDLDKSASLVSALIRGGADIVEIGVPFSDPIADGPTNQRAATRALEAGTTLSGIFELVARVKRESTVPVVLFSYLNPILARGVETFAEQAAESGVDGVLCVDLPPEEASAGYLEALRAYDIDTIFLLAPTSTPQRIQKALEVSSGFVYYVSRTGVTGVQNDLSEGLRREIKRVRKRSSLPVAVGFGISTPDQVQAVGRWAEGVVVGSALVRIIEGRTAQADLAAAIEEETRRLSSALSPSKGV